MNIITHDKAYSFYPRATFSSRCSLLCKDNVGRDISSKYQKRGWSMYTPYDICAATATLYSIFSLGRRYVGDSCCWTIPLACSSNLAPGYIEGNSWVMRIKSSHWSNLGAEVTTHYNVLASKRLKFSYVVGPRDWHMEDAVEKYITCTDQPPENVQESQWVLPA